VFLRHNQNIDNMPRTLGAGMTIRTTLDVGMLTLLTRGYFAWLRSPTIRSKSGAFGASHFVQPLAAVVAAGMFTGTTLLSRRGDDAGAPRGHARQRGFRGGFEPARENSDGLNYSLASRLAFCHQP
jgi:hypothetical protein